MPVIAVVNRKGGSGKSTLATNIAAWCASSGYQVMLGDIDRQRSVSSWLARRASDAPLITSWAVDRSKVLRPPAGTTHVVLDTPGALYDHDLAKLAINVSAMVVPIGPSLFDMDASLQFLKELKQLPRVSTGRCRVVAVGMRWPEEKCHAWLSCGKEWDTQLLTVIPEAPLYRTCLDTGASVFDPEYRSDADLVGPWSPLLRWLQLTWPEQNDISSARESQAHANLDKKPVSEQAKLHSSAVVSRPTSTVVSGPAPLVSPVSRLPSEPVTAPVKAHSNLHQRKQDQAVGWLEKLFKRRPR